MCYFPYKHAFVAGEGHKVTLRLGELESFENASIFERWQHCLTYLDNRDIKCSIRVNCLSDYPGDSKYIEWLAQLKLNGHHILHEEHCVCGLSNSPRTYPMGMMPQLASLLPLLNNSPDPCLQLSQPSDAFKKECRSLLTQSNKFTIEGDPTDWGQDKFRHFEENIQYLLVQGIKFEVDKKL